MTTELQAIQLSIGDELLVGRTVDTNAAVLARVLYECGIPVIERWTIGDEAAALEDAFRRAAAQAPIVVASGGLGATRDDRTRDVLAAVAGVSLVEATSVRERLDAFARARRRDMHATWYRQAQLPEGAELIPNPVGLAPGIWLEWQGAVLCALPGVPSEVEAIAAGPLRQKLHELEGRRGLASASIRLVSVAESDIDRLLGDVDLDGGELAFLPGPETLDLVVRAGGDDAAARVERGMGRVRARIEAELGRRILGATDTDLAERVLDVLRRCGFMLRLAESCTGGGIAHRLTDVPGASDVVDRGFVTYTNAAKTELCGVDPMLIEEHGAVSAEVALAMARGARGGDANTVALAVTGIAGPGGGSAEKPVGLVYLAIDGPRGPSERRLMVPGARATVRRRTVTAGLDLLRLYALE